MIMNTNSRPKRRSAICITLCLAMLTSGLALSGCKSSDDSWYPAGMKLASSEDADYKLWVPDSWTIDMSTGITSAYVGGGSGVSDFSNVSVIALTLEGGDIGMTPAQYWEKYKSDLESTFPDIAYDEENPDGISMLLNDAPAIKYSYTATVTGASFRYFSIICVNEGTVYLMTFTVRPELYTDDFADAMQKITDNFRFAG